MKGPRMSAKLEIPKDALDLSSTYFKSVIAIPEMIAELTESIQELVDTMVPLSLYFRNKGMSENLFTPDDLEAIDGTGPDNE